MGGGASPEREASRRHADRLFVRGETPAGRQLGVVYELYDGIDVYVITAFDLD